MQLPEGNIPLALLRYAAFAGIQYELGKPIASLFEYLVDNRQRFALFYDCDIFHEEKLRLDLLYDMCVGDGQGCPSTRLVTMPGSRVVLAWWPAYDDVWL